MVHPPLSQASPRLTNIASSAPVRVREDTPWPGTGKMSGNLFEERNWVLPKDYFSTEDKKEDATIAKPLLKEEPKMGELTSNQKEGKCGWGPNCPFCKAQKKDGEDQQQKPLPEPQAMFHFILHEDGRHIFTGRFYCQIIPNFRAYLYIYTSFMDNLHNSYCA